MRFEERAARALAVFGTASDVGKSVVATALCRHFAHADRRVAPFKAQNMSNNSGVTLDGLEMGRAQMVQAQAARVEPHVDMNPVLLKPSSGSRSQVVLLGRPISDRSAGDYFEGIESVRASAFAALERLMNKYDILVIEGAGSCAEVNLRPRDFVNFAVAHAAQAPVVIVADIDRGGVFAQVIGTLEVMPEHDRARVAGFIVNRFRGDASLFESGAHWLEQRSGLPIFGVLPYLPSIAIEAEDAVVLDRASERRERRVPTDGRAWVAVIRLPHVSNFTDFDPLQRDARVQLHYIDRDTPLDDYDAVMLPGTKAVRADLAWLRESGLARRVLARHAAGGVTVGVCGGYQMLGVKVADPMGIESEPGESPGLGLLDVTTEFEPVKRLAQVTGVTHGSGAPVRGYEIHMGRTQRGNAAPFASLGSGVAEREDGAVSPDGQCWGTYLHGVLDSPVFRDEFLARLGCQEPAVGAAATSEDAIEELTAHFVRYVDVRRLEQLVGV